MNKSFLVLLFCFCLFSCGDDDMPMVDNAEAFEFSIETFDISGIDNNPIIKKVISSNSGTTFALIENRDTDIRQIIEFRNNEWVSFAFDFCTDCIGDIDISENGDLWVVAPGSFPFDQTGVGMYRFKNNTWETLLTDGGYSDVIVTNDNEAWVKNFDQGLGYYSNNQVDFKNGSGTPVTNVASGFALDLNNVLWIRFPSSLGYHDGATYGIADEPDFPEQITVDGSNRVWIGFGWGELGYFENMVWNPGAITEFEGNTFFRDVDADDKNSVWIGKDLLVRMQDNGVRTDFPMVDLTGGDGIDNISVDRQDRKWVSTDGVGLMVMISDVQ